MMKNANFKGTLAAAFVFLALFGSLFAVEAQPVILPHIVPEVIDEGSEIPLFATIDSFPIVNKKNVENVQLSGTCSDEGTIYLTLKDSADSTNILGVFKFVCTGGVWYYPGKEDAKGSLDLSPFIDGPIIAEVTYYRYTDGEWPHIDVSKNSVKDTLGPIVEITSFPEVDGSNYESAPISGTCRDEEAEFWGLDTPDMAVSLKVVDTEGDTTSVDVLCTGGIWSASLDLSDKKNGLLVATAEVSDAAGNDNQDSESSNKDTIYITLDVFPIVNEANQNSAALSGTCHLPGIMTIEEAEEEGIEYVNPYPWPVSLSIPNADGLITTISAECNDALWSADADLSGADEGALSATATIDWEDGTSASDSKDSYKDTLGVMVDITSFPAVDAANALAVTIAGTCSEELPEAPTVPEEDGADSPAIDLLVMTVQLAVTDSANNTTTTAVECADGTWSSTFDLSGKRDGALMATATVDDGSGNTGTDSMGSTKTSPAPPVSPPTGTGGGNGGGSNNNGGGLLANPIPAPSPVAPPETSPVEGTQPTPEAAPTETSEPAAPATAAPTPAPSGIPAPTSEVPAAVPAAAALFDLGQLGSWPWIAICPIGIIILAILVFFLLKRRKQAKK